MAEEDLLPALTAQNAQRTIMRIKTEPFRITSKVKLKVSCVFPIGGVHRSLYKWQLFTQNISLSIQKNRNQTL